MPVLSVNLSIGERLNLIICLLIGWALLFAIGPCVVF